MLKPDWFLPRGANQRSIRPAYRVSICVVCQFNRATQYKMIVHILRDKKVRSFVTKNV